MKKRILELIEKYEKRAASVLVKYNENNNPFYAGEQAICDNIIADLKYFLNGDTEKRENKIVCLGCKEEFTPEKPYHNVCDNCAKNW